MGTVADISDDELLRRAVRCARPRFDDERAPTAPRWCAVMDTFGLGRTYSHQLCERFDLDPDEQIDREGARFLADLANDDAPLQQERTNLRNRLQVLSRRFVRTRAAAEVANSMLTFNIKRADRAEAEVERLASLLNTPETADWVRGVELEAAHQIERWGTTTDVGKTPFDWFWLIGYLAQKAAEAHQRCDAEKALHHTISTGAALLNWHRAIVGTDVSMRPGIEPPSTSGETHV